MAGGGRLITTGGPAFCLLFCRLSGGPGRGGGGRRNFGGGRGGASGNVGDGGTKLAIGYFRANSTALCAVEDCSIISPLLLKTLLSLRAALAAGSLPRGLREIEAFVDAADSRVLLTATFAGFPSRAAEHAETFRRIVP